MHLIHGFDIEKAGRPECYYVDRDIFLDCRGNLKIHPSANWGWQVMVITQSHDISNGDFGGAIDRRVVVEEGAWIGSGAILYNCTIGHHAIVAAGAVVRNSVVDPYTIVEGNPAKPTRRFVNGKWVKAVIEPTVQEKLQAMPFVVSDIVGFCCGAFDCLHPGHILMLADAKAQCDILIVGLHVDPSVERPDKNKPVQTVDERLMILQSIRYVDEIRTYETEAELVDLLWSIRPDVRVLGEDWRGKPITAPDAARRIHWHKRDHNWSSTEMRRRIWEAGGGWINTESETESDSN